MLLVSLAGFTIGGVSTLAVMYAVSKLLVSKGALDEPRDR